KHADFLTNEASSLVVPSVSASGFSGGACCSASSAIEIRVDYYAASCPPWNGCTPISQNNISMLYPAGDLGTVGTAPAGCTPSPTCGPAADDVLRVTVVAHGAQVITPLVRPFFGCTNGSNPRCY